MKLTTLIAAVSAGFSCAIVAQTERDLESHEHGIALLNVAIDSELLFIELDTPWNNLVGFEHTPGNSEQQSLVDNALVQLKQPEALFNFEGTDCTLADTQIENSADHDDDHKEEHEEEHEDEHNEAKEGEDEHHDDEHGESEHADDEAESHSSIRVAYSFECDNINKLSIIDVNLFKIWPGFEELNAQLIGPTGQAATTLMPGATILDTTLIQ